MMAVGSVVFLVVLGIVALVVVGFLVAAILLWRRDRDDE
jgi:hypothetical protein